MNAWFTVLDTEGDGAEGSLLVAEWNDEGMVLVRDKRGETVVQVWLGADQVFAMESVFRYVFGPKDDE